LSDCKIYLSGPMFNCTEQEVFGWRLEAKKLLGTHNWRAGWGTAMEVRYAYDKRKLVASVVNGPVSVWLKCHSDYIASTVAEAAHWLAVQLRLKGTVWDEA
jgi:hypothetical protein